MLRIFYGGITDIGLVRSNNEDAYHIDTVARYCLVADGMGGAAAGETASCIFAQSAQDILGSDIYNHSITDNDITVKIRLAFQTANDRILTHVARNPQDAGMGRDRKSPVQGGRCLRRV